MFLPENPGAPGGLPWSLAAPPVIDNRTQTKVPKILPPGGKILGFSRQTPVFPGFAGVLETRQNPGKQGVNHYKNTLTPLRFSVLPDSPFIKTGNSNRARKGNREHEKNFNRPPQVPLSSRRNTQETRRCNPAETGRVIGKTRVNPGMGKPKPPLSYPEPATFRFLGHSGPGHIPGRMPFAVARFSNAKTAPSGPPSWSTCPQDTHGLVCLNA